MTWPVLVLTALFACTAAGGAADAAPSKRRPAKPVCQLITDPRGDTVAYPIDGMAPVNPDVPVADAQGDDVISADIASDRTTVTAVVRPAALAATDPRAPAGRSYLMLFRSVGSPEELYLSARTYPTGPLYSYGFFRTDSDGNVKQTRLGDARGTVDFVKGEVRMSTSLRSFSPATRTPAGLASERTITDLYSLIGRNLTTVPSQDAPAGQRVPTGRTVPLDAGVGETDYRLGSPSCVPIGK